MVFLFAKEVESLAGVKYTAKEKTVQKMTRDGLTEEHIGDGQKKDMPDKTRGRPSARFEKQIREASLRQEEVSAGESVDGSKLERRISVDGDPQSRQRITADSEKVRNRSEKIRDHETVPDTDGLDGQKSQIKTRQKKARLKEEQAKSGRLAFDDEGSQMVRGAGMGVGHKAAGTAASAASVYVHVKASEEADDNAAVDAASAGELMTERAAVSLKRTQDRSKRADVRASRRGIHMESTSESRLKFTQGGQEGTGSTSFNKKKQEDRQTVMNRFFQRKRYKEAYQSARSGAASGKAGASKAAAATETMTTKAKNALKEVARRNHAVFAVLGIFGLLFLLIAVAFSSCSASVQGSGSVIGITTYPSSDEDIYAAENAYAALEAALNEQINQMESTHPDYDEYNYNVSEISHNPYHLISYLTAKYGDWTYADVEAEIEALFSEQYSLHTEGRTETVTETRTVRVGESLGQVVTSGYCSCSICCGQWSGGPTASGVYPTANHTLAVDASNPIVPMGTKVVMNGVEYTVEDTGAFDRYGVDFDVYYDDHASASAHGHKTWECYLADDNGSNEVTVTDTRTVKILYVTLTNQGLDAIARENLDEEQLILYNALNTTLGNRDYLWDSGVISGGSGGMDYDIPPEALEDEEFARMIHEAEKYLGVPYVWGGYSPSGFDCSGFVSYVVNNCGNGWNYGRLTAEGLRGQCTYVAPGEAKPGDLIFFQGTYNTSGASHIGIYVGNGMMIHCGDPVQYANINSSYWQQHFMCYGRLP